jgi:regulator of protease activity HflC (stomatin/prohibitin superfamily)
MGEFAVVLFVVFVTVVVVVAALRKSVRAVTVFEYERGLRYTKGRFAGIVPPGRYWVMSSSTTIQKVDIRPTFVSITGQEVLISDGVALKVSLAAKYEVADPDIAVNKVANYYAALYLELQLGLRQIIGGAPIDDLLGKRQDFGKQLHELTANKIAGMGLTLIEVEIKDIMFPGELKKIFTQVVKARQDGLAALERARGETAALRNLANAAALVERNPMLMQLRLLQAVSQSSGNTIVLGMPSSGPIPIQAKTPGEIEVKDETTPGGES